MRKRLITPTPSIRTHGPGWLDTERAAVAEVTSKTRTFRSRHPWSQGIREAGVRQFREVRRFVWSLINRKGSGAYLLFLKKRKLSGPKNSSCAGLTDGGAHQKRLCAKSGIFSSPLIRYEAEDYKVDLSNVTLLELLINPSIADGVARASLKTSGCLETRARPRFSA